MRYLVTLLMLLAALNATEPGKMDTLIDEIVHAPEQERFEKMNAFKDKMRELNRQQRAEALETLRARMHADDSEAASSRTATAAATAAGTQQQEMQQQMQMQQMRTQQQQMQQMKQKMQDQMLQQPPMQPKAR